MSAHEIIEQLARLTPAELLAIERRARELQGRKAEEEGTPRRGISPIIFDRLQELRLLPEGWDGDTAPPRR